MEFSFAGFVFSVILFLASWITINAQSLEWNTQDSLRISYEGTDFVEVSYGGIGAADSLHCLAFGFANLISVANLTTDGGRTWNVVFTDTGYIHGKGDPIYIHDVAMPTSQLYIMVGDSGSIFRSTDAGGTWSRIPCDALYDNGTLRFISYFYSVSMFDSLHGVVAGFSKVTLITDDGGLTWKRIPTPHDDVEPFFVTLDAIRLSRQTILLLLARQDAGYFTYRSDDEGKTWTEAPIDSILNLSFVDSLNGWGCGVAYTGPGYTGEDLISRTTDGGRTWRTILNERINPAYGLTGISFADQRNGFASGRAGKILRTTDGGEHWFKTGNIDSTANTNVMCITYPVAGKAWAATMRGQILYYDAWKSSGVSGSLPEFRSEPIALSPNPALTTITLDFSTTIRGRVSLSIHDELGHPVATVIDGTMEPGARRVAFDTRGLPAGGYFAQLRTSRGVTTQRFVVTH